jgi:hypothetical protein
MDQWAAAGFVGTEFRCLMEQERIDGSQAVYA